jgi:hypothetical protein
VVIRDGRHPAEERLGQSGGRGGVRQLVVDPDRRIGRRHARQPVPHRDATGAGQRPEGRLQQVVMGVDQPGSDDAAGRVQLDGTVGGGLDHDPVGAGDHPAGHLVDPVPHQFGPAHDQHRASLSAECDVTATRSP